MKQTLVHATCVALAARDQPGDQPGDSGSGTEPGRIFGVLLRGPSGAGKSDLALRLIDAGWRLVADDQTALRAAGSHVIAAAPASIAGQLEVRGLGILSVPRLAEAELCLVVDLVPAGAVERLPAPETHALLGTEVPALRLDPFEVSAPAKLRLAARRAAAAIMGASRHTRTSRPGAQRRNRGEMPDEARTADHGAEAAGAAQRIVLVTGVSGAGRTSVLDILEDFGYEAIDNPPLDLLETLIATASERSMAIGVDIRTRDFSAAPFIEQLDRLTRNPGLAISLLFVDCDDEVLRRRYSETRRRHPLAQGRPLADGIAAERRLVVPLRDRADLVIDTSGLRLADLRQILTGHLGSHDAAGMAVFVTSFSYRHGLPRAADLVFDVRFLDNPHYEEPLRALTGRDRAVADFITADPGFGPFFAQLTGMLGPLLPRYQREGKSYLTIALGCTGGRHRSVMVAERLAAWLADGDHRVTLVHRDLAPDSDRT